MGGWRARPATRSTWWIIRRRGKVIATFDFEQLPLSPPTAPGVAAPRVRILAGDASVNGSKALVGTTTDAAAANPAIIYSIKPGLFQAGHRYRFSLDYRVLAGAPPDGTACLVLKENQTWRGSYLHAAPGPAQHVGYEFLADHPDASFSIGIQGAGEIAVDNLQVEELPVIAFSPDSALTTPPEAGPMSAQVGICAHLDWPYFYKTDDEVRRGVEAIRDLGVTWVRTTFTWDMLFHHPGWTPDPAALARMDLIVDEVTKQHLHLLCVIGAPPEWAVAPHPKGVPSWKLPAASLDDYRHYVRFLAERYRGRITAWEIHNEPNGEFWDAPFAAYLEELRAAGPLLHQIDPANTVISAGLVEAGLLAVPAAQRDPYLELLKPENAACYDAFGFHSYADVASTLYMLNIVGEAMKANGTRKPIWITETGFTVVGPKTEADQAADIPLRVRMLTRDPLVENVFIYNLRMKTFEKRANERGFGLIRGDFTRRPAFEALRDLLKSAALQKDPAITAVDGL